MPNDKGNGKAEPNKTRDKQIDREELNMPERDDREYRMTDVANELAHRHARLIAGIPLGFIDAFVFGAAYAGLGGDDNMGRCVAGGVGFLVGLGTPHAVIYMCRKIRKYTGKGEE